MVKIFITLWRTLFVFIVEYQGYTRLSHAGLSILVNKILNGLGPQLFPISYSKHKDNLKVVRVKKLKLSYGVQYVALSRTIHALLVRLVNMKPYRNSIKGLVPTLNNSTMGIRFETIYNDLLDEHFELLPPRSLPG